MADATIIQPTTTHTHTMIILHGRDTLASEFAPELFESQASDARTLPETFPTFKWVFPTSALRPSARFGTALSQWFDLWSTDDPDAREEMQVAGLAESVAAIREILHREAAVIRMDRIILAGISQGCATAIHALLRGECRVGAFVGFCGWLPFRAEVEAVARRLDTRAERAGRLRSLLGSDAESEEAAEGAANGALETPIFLAHSRDDDMVPIRNGERLRDGLVGLGMSVEWHAYEDGGHWLNEPQGIDNVVAFLRRVC